MSIVSVADVDLWEYASMAEGVFNALDDGNGDDHGDEVVPVEDVDPVVARFFPNGSRAVVFTITQSEVGYLYEWLGSRRDEFVRKLADWKRGVRGQLFYQAHEEDFKFLDRLFEVLLERCPSTVSYTDYETMEDEEMSSSSLARVLGFSSGMHDDMRRALREVRPLFTCLWRNGGSIDLRGGPSAKSQSAPRGCRDVRVRMLLQSYDSPSQTPTTLLDLGHDLLGMVLHRSLVAQAMRRFNRSFAIHDVRNDGPRCDGGFYLSYWAYCKGVVRYACVDSTFLGVVPRLRLDRRFTITSIFDKVSGLKWRKLRGEPPGSTMRIRNYQLQTALAGGKLEFTPDEWDAFGLSNLDMTHVVCVDEHYFQPIDRDPDATVHQIELMLTEKPRLNVRLSSGLAEVDVSWMFPTHASNKGRELCKLHKIKSSECTCEGRLMLPLFDWQVTPDRRYAIVCKTSCVLCASSGPEDSLFTRCPSRRKPLRHVDSAPRRMWNYGPNLAPAVVSQQLSGGANGPVLETRRGNVSSYNVVMSTSRMQASDLVYHNFGGVTLLGFRPDLALHAHVAMHKSTRIYPDGVQIVPHELHGSVDVVTRISVKKKRKHRSGDGLAAGCQMPRHAPGGATSLTTW